MSLKSKKNGGMRKTIWFFMFVVASLSLTSLGANGLNCIADPQLLAAELEASAWGGAFLFLALFVVAGSVVPPVVFVVAAGLVWPFAR